MQSVYKRQKIGKSRARKYRPKYGAAAAITKQAAVKQVANMRTGGFVGLEKKFFDTQTLQSLASARTTALMPVKQDDNTYATATSTNKALFCPGIGSGQSQRDGRQCYLDSVWSTLDLSLLPSNPISPANLPLRSVRIYVALVLDTQCNGAVFDPSQVYRGYTGYDIDLINPMRDLENIQRFRVLQHQLVNIPVDINFSDSTADEYHVCGGTRSVTLTHRFSGGLKVHFKGENIDVGDLSDNNVGLVAWLADAWAQTAFNVQLVGKTRCRFRG